MNGDESPDSPNQFTDFTNAKVADEGPARTRFIARKKKRYGKRKKRRSTRAS